MDYGVGSCRPRVAVSKTSHQQFHTHSGLSVKLAPIWAYYTRLICPPYLEDRNAHLSNFSPLEAHL